MFDLGCKSADSIASQSRTNRSYILALFHGLDIHGFKRRLQVWKGVRNVLAADEDISTVGGTVIISSLVTRECGDIPIYQTLLCRKPSSDRTWRRGHRAGDRNHPDLTLAICVDANASIWTQSGVPESGDAQLEFCVQVVWLFGRTCRSCSVLTLVFHSVCKQQYNLGFFWYVNPEKCRLSCDLERMRQQRRSETLSMQLSVSQVAGMVTNHST